MIRKIKISEPKTLNDIKSSFVTTNLIDKTMSNTTNETFISRLKLRQEAIEWIKHLRDIQFFRQLFFLL